MRRCQEDISPFPFLCLPFEIRLRIYSYYARSEYGVVDWAHLGPRNTRITHENYYVAPEPTYGILFTNQQLHTEFKPVLYQSCTFEFGLELARGLYFLQKLSESARLNIRSIGMIQAVPWTSPEVCEFELDERNMCRKMQWTAMCNYASKNLKLRHLVIDSVVISVPKNFTNVGWVQDLIQIRGLQRLSQGCMDCDDCTNTIYTYENTSRYEQGKITSAHRLQEFLKFLRTEMLAGDAPAPSRIDLVWGYSCQHSSSLRAVRN